MAEKNAVSICIPAYRAKDFIAETLQSALSQTWPVEIFVSVDPADDDTATRVRDELAGRSATIIEQQKRLGWVGNCNAALRLARTRHVMLLPHDDILEPTYVERCMTALAAEPNAILAYSDIGMMTARKNVVREPSERGPHLARIARMVRSHFNAVAFRGVFRRRRTTRFAIPKSLGNFAADTLWVARMAAQGDIVRVPEVLYRKRTSPRSAHMPWKRASEAELDDMWVVHCFELYRTLALVRPAILTDRTIRDAFRSRLMREDVHFRSIKHSPRQLDPAKSLARQVATIYARAARRHPHYSWSGQDSDTARTLR